MRLDGVFYVSVWKYKYSYESTYAKVHDPTPLVLIVSLMLLHYNPTGNPYG